MPPENLSRYYFVII